MKEKKIVDRWSSDAGVAFFDDDGKETRVTDKKKERKIEKSIRRDRKAVRK